MLPSTTTGLGFPYMYSRRHRHPAQCWRGLLDMETGQFLDFNASMREVLARRPVLGAEYGPYRRESRKEVLFYFAAATTPPVVLPALSLHHVAAQGAA